MVGRERLDLTIDPPPDLAVEVDVTSKTQISAYQALKVPEVWRYDRGELKTSVLCDGLYVDAQFSPLFPGLPLREVIPQFVKRGHTEVMSSVRRAFRQWVRSQLK